MPWLEAGIDRLPFVDKASDTMHVDINSCFATIEQQCNALLRGKPVAVAAYTTPHGCILSPSIEAKRFGVKTTMRVMDGKRLCPDLVVLPTDPWKYRWVNRQLQHLFVDFTPQVQMLSIDEAVLRFGKKAGEADRPIGDLEDLALRMKQRIRQEIGDWLSVSIGLGPNRWLAKMAAGLKKPDGLEELNWWNIEEVLSCLCLEDLHGISRGNARRLRSVGLLQPIDVYRADISTLRQAFHSILGVQWYVKMRGYECEERPVQRKSFSHVYSLPRPVLSDDDLAAVVSKMVHSVSFRLHRALLRARGVYVDLWYGEGSGWSRHAVGEHFMHDQVDLYRAVMRLIGEREEKLPVRRISCGCFDLESTANTQTTWLEDELAKKRKVEAVERIHQRYGKYALMPARMLEVQHQGWLKDAISFGGVRELDDIPFEEAIEIEEVEDESAQFWEE